MIQNILFSKTMGLMERGLDAASLRNTVIANNLANIDTPGYKRSDVVFEQELRKALGQRAGLNGTLTDKRHIPIGSRPLNSIAPQVVPDKTTTMRNDGNNVDVDREMAGLAKNTITYSVLAQELNGEFSKLKYVISEGRR